MFNLRIIRKTLGQLRKFKNNSRKTLEHLSCNSGIILVKLIINFSHVHTTLHPALSVHPLVGRSHYFFYDFYFRTSLLLPKWSSDLKYGPCPPAHDFGSPVFGLVHRKIWLKRIFLISWSNLPTLLGQLQDKSGTTEGQQRLVFQCSGTCL